MWLRVEQQLIKWEAGMRRRMWQVELWFSELRPIPLEVDKVIWLVVWNMAFIFHFKKRDVILPIDELIFFKMVF
jgi:hypothetical protein